MRSLQEIKRKILKRKQIKFSDGVLVKKIDEVDIIPNLRCNLNCVMCHQAEIKHKQNMSLEDFKKIIENLKNEKVTKVSLVGGEIFVLKDLWRYIIELERSGLKYDLATNAFALSDEDIKRFTKLRGLEKVNTSLDGTEKIHDAIRRIPGAYKRTVSAIKKMLKLGLRVNVGCVIQKANFDKLEEIAEHLCKLGIKDITFLIEINVTERERQASKRIIKNITGEDSEIFISSKKNPFGRLGEEEYSQIEEKRKKIQDIAKKHDAVASFSLQAQDTDLLINKTSLKHYGCAIFRGYNFSIYNEGSLTFCPFIALKGDYKILDKSPKKVVNSNSYIKLRNHFKEYGALPVCRKCCALERKRL